MLEKLYKTNLVSSGKSSTFARKICREKITFTRQDNRKMNALTIENKILAKIKKRGRGSVYFVSDFVNYGTRASVNKALERLTDEGTIMRVARGIYCYPMIDRTFGTGQCPPSTDDIAKAVARRDGASIVPAEAWAQYQLGMTQQVPMNMIFLTNGPSRTIKTEIGLNIKFKHASPRYFSMKNIVACMIITALKDWKVENLSKEQLEKLKAVVKEHGPFPAEDIKLMPANVRELIQSFEAKD